MRYLAVSLLTWNASEPDRRGATHVVLDTNGGLIGYEERDSMMAFLVHFPGLGLKFANVSQPHPGALHAIPEKKHRHLSIRVN